MRSPEWNYKHALKSAAPFGEDTEFRENLSDEKLLRAKAQKLEEKLRAFFPDLDFEIEAAWAGAFEETKDSLAYFGAAPDTPALLFALGYGGNGIAYGMVAAEILRDDLPRPAKRPVRPLPLRPVVGSRPRGVHESTPVAGSLRPSRPLARPPAAPPTP